MSARELIYLHPTNHTDILMPRLRSAGWNVVVANDADEARDVIQQRNIHVGLAHLDDNTSSRHDVLNLWPSTGRMEWVAMLDSERLHSGNLSRIITDHFYDYHTLPADVNRLLFSLGHAFGMATMSRSSREGRNVVDSVAHGRGLTLAQARDEAERVVILSTIRRTSGNITRAARELDISRVTLYRLMHKHQIGN